MKRKGASWASSKNPAPRLDWLNFVVTKQAASRIKQWFKKNNREDHINLGKANIEHELTKAVFDEYIKHPALSLFSLTNLYSKSQYTCQLVTYFSKSLLINAAFCLAILPIEVISLNSTSASTIKNW
jgi:hypothetical protein